MVEQDLFDDAMRYRWLKKHNFGGAQLNEDCAYLHIVGRHRGGELVGYLKFVDNTGYDINDLDSLIDKARRLYAEIEIWKVESKDETV